MHTQDVELIIAVVTLAAFALFAIVMSFIQFNRNPEGRYLDDTHDRAHGTGRRDASATKSAR